MATKNAVRGSTATDSHAMGRGVRHHAARPSADGELWQEEPWEKALWEKSFDEAVRQGAGPDVARVFANQTVTYERAEREGVELPGAGNYQDYR